MSYKSILCASASLALAFTMGAAFADNVYLNSGKVVKGHLPFSEAVRVDGTLYLSGHVGLVPGSLTLVPGGIAAEAKQAMENVKTSLEAHGYRLSDVVKCLVILADMRDSRVEVECIAAK